MERLKTGGGPARGQKLVYSTTDGRQRFPDILQVSYGEKAVIGFDRYGRALGAVVPMEAVQMLAGRLDAVDDDVRERIERAARALLETMQESEPALELEEIAASRRGSATSGAAVRGQGEKPRRRAS